MDRQKLKDKLKGLKKQFKKDAKEGRFKKDRYQKANLIKTLDPFNMKVLSKQLSTVYLPLQ